MSQNGSAIRRPFHIFLALPLVVLGVVAMVGSVRLAGPLGLGLRGQIALGTLALAAPTLLALAFLRRATGAVLGRVRVAPRTVALSALLGAALWVGSIGLIELQSLVRPPSSEELELFRRLHAALAPSSLFDGVGSLVVIAVLPAMCEELVMRGVLLTSLCPVTGPLFAVFLTAGAFAVIHDPLRLLFAFVLGLAFGALRLRTGSLVPPLISHASLNALTFFVAPLIDDPTQPYTPQPALGLACLLAGAAVAWPLFRALRPLR